MVHRPLMHSEKRWKDGCKKGSILYREMKEKGYRGTDRQVYRFLHTLKQDEVELPELPVLSRVSVREADWLLARLFDDLEADERADLEALCQSSTELSVVCQTPYSTNNNLLFLQTSGTTATASISMRKSGFPSPETYAIVMVGGLGRSPQNC